MLLNRSEDLKKKFFSIKKKRLLTIIGSTIILLIIGISFSYNKYTSRKENNIIPYDIEILKNKEPMLFTGLVKAKQIEYFSFNPSLGETINYNTTNGEIVKKNDVIATYTNIEKEVTAPVIAPFDGTIYTNGNAKTDSNKPYAMIVSPDTIIEGSVSQYDYKSIKAGQKVSIIPTNGEDTIQGEIDYVDQLPENISLSPTEVFSSSDHNISNYSFIVSPDQNLQYGYTVQISIPNTVLEIPKKSVIHSEHRSYVFLIKDKKSYKQYVKVKDNIDSYIVEDGLKINDKLIINPDEDLEKEPLTVEES